MAKQRKAKQPKGDGVYTRKDRKGFFISWIDAQGKRRHRKTAAHTLMQARNALSAERLRAEQNKVLGFTQPGSHTFAEIAARFVKHQEARLTPESFLREKGIVKNQLIPTFAGKIATITPSDVQSFVTRRSNEVAAASVVKELNTLKHLFGLAIEWEVINASPAQRVKGPRPPAGRLRYLQPTEVKALLLACPSWLRPVVGLAVSTGMRRGEILRLRSLDVDLEGRRVMLPQTKNGDGRIVYLNRTALTALESVLVDGLPSRALIFDGVCADYVTQTFRHACIDVGIEDFRFHDLRHTAASWMRMSGADIHTVALALGHKDLRMAARYQHLSPAFLGEAVAKLDGVFGDLRCPDVASQNLLPATELVTTTN